MAFYLLKSIEWLNPIIYLVGLVICIRAYKNCRKLGYLIVAIYFFLATASLVFGPTIHRVLAERLQNESKLSPDAEKQYSEELVALGQKYFPQGRAMSYNIHFPLGSVILVSGIWILAKHDSKKSPN